MLYSVRPPDTNTYLNRKAIWTVCCCFSPYPDIYCNGKFSTVTLWKLLEHSPLCVYEGPSYHVKACWHRHRLCRQTMLLVNVTVRTAFCVQTVESLCFTCRASFQSDLTDGTAASTFLLTCLFIPHFREWHRRFISVTKQCFLLSRDSAEILH